MQSRTVQLPVGPCPPEILRQAAAAPAAAGRPPDLALAFLPPNQHLTSTLDTMAALWPGSLRFGCEAVSQFAGGTLTTCGSVQLFWFDVPGHGTAVDVIEASHDAPLPADRIAALARRLATSDGALLLVDGLRFPTERFLADLRRQLAAASALPWIAGGLASQREPVTPSGARVFFQQQVLSAACLAVVFHGVDMQVEVVRGWDPASPIYAVDRAAGNVVFEIDGIAATDWYRRFFTVDGELAPMPASAYRFPLIVEGPRPERQGLYRSMRFFDQPPGAVTYWGSVETGDRVRLGMGNDVSLMRTAATLSPGCRPLEAAILYSCVGRELVLGDRAGVEVATIHRALGGAALSGFFTFAEIGPTPRGDLAFYNQTAILVLLAEKRAA
jgi:hypothetical protein